MLLKLANQDWSTVVLVPAHCPFQLTDSCCNQQERDFGGALFLSSPTPSRSVFSWFLCSDVQDFKGLAPPPLRSCFMVPGRN